MGSHRLGLAEGTALYVGAVLGPGVLALPSLGARAAGPASIIAWAGMLLLSAPVAVAFAALGARFPDGGGVATFVSRAFGVRASAMVGWWFYAAVPVGVLAGAIIGGEYVAAMFGGGDDMVILIAGVLLLIAFAANYVGLQLSGRMQLLLVSLLVLLLVVTMVTAAPHSEPANFQPFAPHGWWAIGTAASVLFYAFAGWEAASHLSAEFRDPKRHIALATTTTLIVVGALYVGLTATVFGVLGAQAAITDVPLTLLLERGMGSATRGATAAAAVFLTLGAINAYIAGGARLGAAMGRDGSLPRALAKGGNAGDVPRRSLTVQAACCALTGAAAVIWKLDLDTLMRATSACLAAVTVAGMLAAMKLLPRYRPLWWGAMAGVAFTTTVLAFSGVLLGIPVALAAVGLVAVVLRHRHRARHLARSFRYRGRHIAATDHQSPARHTPAHPTPARHKPADHPPAYQPPIHQQPVHYAAAHHAATHQMPIHLAPANHAPANHAPANHAPIHHAAAQHAAAHDAAAYGTAANDAAAYGTAAHDVAAYGTAAHDVATHDLAAHNGGAPGVAPVTRQWPAAMAHACAGDATDIHRRPYGEP